MNDLIESEVLPLSQSISINAESVHVIYSWKLGKRMFLSKARKVIVDTYLETRNYHTCQEVLNRECKRKISVPTIKRWLELPDVKAYIYEQFEEKGIYNGWTKEHWFKVMTDHLMGRERLANGDLYAMKLIGAMKGWEAQPVHNNLMNISIVQRNGKE